MRLGIPRVDEHGVRLPALYLACEGRSLQAAEMVQPRMFRRVVDELMVVAVEQGYIPFDVRAESSVECAVGGLRPCVEHTQVDLLQ